MSNPVRAWWTVLTSILLFNACSSGPNDGSDDTSATTIVTAATTTEIGSTDGWSPATEPTPSYASWVVFCCDAGFPESPALDSSTTSLTVGAYPVRIGGLTDDGRLVLSVARFGSCDDGEFRNRADSDCLQPSPDEPRGVAVDLSTEIRITLPLDDPGFVVHVIGHQCGSDGSVGFADWRGSGTDFAALAELFDDDFDTYLAPLVATGNTRFSAATDPGSLGLPDRFSTTCTAVGYVWSDEPGPAIWMPGISVETPESGRRPFMDVVWGRTLIVTPDRMILFTYAGYTP